jgi:hypothetical protein
VQNLLSLWLTAPVNSTERKMEPAGIPGSTLQKGYLEWQKGARTLGSPLIWWWPRMGLCHSEMHQLCGALHPPHLWASGSAPFSARQDPLSPHIWSPHFSSGTLSVGQLLCLSILRLVCIHHTLSLPRSCFTRHGGSSL